MNSSSFTNLIVTYNSANDILNLLADLRRHAPASKTILIDNASQDTTVKLVREHYPEMQLIENSTNVGFARAVNQGFELCDTPYILLLNPDIRIAGHQVFAALEACLKSSQRVAAAAPLQFKSDENKRHLNFSWSYTNLESFKLYLAFLLQLKKSFQTSMQVTFLNGGCLFVRRSAFYRVGKLNEKYFLYGEEPDLFLKFKRYGFQCYLLTDVDVTHYRERSLNTVPLPQRMRIRFQAALNVIDALVTGWSRILFNKLTVRRARKMEGN
jgi:GT2 family glycosyltransferase